MELTLHGPNDYRQGDTAPDVTTQTATRRTSALAGYTAPVSKKRLWAGRIMSGLVVVLLVFDGVTKLMRPPAVMKAIAEIGFPASAVLPIGVVLLACVAIYLVPRTAVLGAVLLTGYLGGAIATNVYAGQPLFSHTLSPIYVAALIWGGLYLRDGRVRAMIGPPASR